MPFSELTATQMTQSCCIETHSSRHICPCCKSGGVLLRVWMILFTTLFTFNNLCNLQPEWNCMTKRSKDRSKVKRGIYGAWRSCGFSCISAFYYEHALLTRVFVFGARVCVCMYARTCDRACERACVRAYVCYCM